MKIERIYAIVLRNLITFKRSYDRWFDAFYAPAIELIIWGLASAYISQGNPKLTNLAFLIVSGISFWLIVYRSQYEANVSLLEETWTKNLINLFVSPLKFSEWIVAVTIIGIIKAMISFTTAAIVAFVMYQMHLFSYGFYLIPLIFLLLMTGWWTSFVIGGLIFRFGTRVSSFAWTLVFLLIPLSGVYYPISSLPSWTQTIAHFLPTSYVFEEIRSVITTGSIHPDKLVISFILNFLYLLLSIFFIRWTYNYLLRKGLLQMF